MKIGNYEFDPDLAWSIGEKIVYALVVLIITWVLAKAAKWAFAKLVDNVSFLQRGTGSGESVGMSLGKIVSLFIWLFGLVVILDVFNLQGVMTPLNDVIVNVRRNAIDASIRPNLWCYLEFEPRC